MKYLAPIMKEEQSDMKNNVPQIAIPSDEGFEFIRKGDILYCRSEGSYTHIHLMGGKTLKVSKRLKLVEGILSDPVFCRIHHSYAVNLCHVARYNKKNTSVVLTGMEGELVIAQSRVAYFMQRFTKL